jgi:LCP family protein required for cell wall assembly
MQEGRGSREQGESVRRWLEERQAEREQRAARSSAQVGDAGSPASDKAAYQSYGQPYGDPYRGAAGGSVDERAPNGFDRSTPGAPWQPSPSPSWDDGEALPPAEPAPRRRRRFGWGKRIALALVVLLAAIVGLTLYFDSKLHRVDAFASYAGRPADSAGTNWLLVGSDSRSDLTEAQRRALATGDAAGGRTDTIMLLHTGGGPNSLISIPRDSYVAIPGHGRNKINAAFALGGPKLLTQTVEQATGLRINHYAEIGFGGFASVVDAVGGVRMCIDKPINDPKAGLNLAAGCQTLNGAQALGYVRTRATPLADLDRVKHQRAFLSALAAKISSPTRVLNPITMTHVLNGTANALNVDKGTHLWTLGRLGLALRSVSRGKGVTMTVPVGGTEVVSGVGDVVLWNQNAAQRLFQALANGDAIPQDLMAK